MEKSLIKTVLPICCVNPVSRYMYVKLAVHNSKLESMVYKSRLIFGVNFWVLTNLMLIMINF